MRQVLAHLVGHVAELAERAADVAGDAVRARLDGCAHWWIMSRRTLSRAQVLELLERLGPQVDAKIEIRD